MLSLTSATKQRLDELEETKSSLEISILQEEMQKPILTREQVTFWIERFRKTDVENQVQRQKLIDSFVNTVYLYDGKSSDVHLQGRLKGRVAGGG